MLEGVGEKPFFVYVPTAPALVHLFNLKRLFKAVLLYEGVHSSFSSEVIAGWFWWHCWGCDTAPPYCRWVPAAVSTPAPSRPWLSAGPAVGVHA